MILGPVVSAPPAAVRAAAACADLAADPAVPHQADWWHSPEHATTAQVEEARRVCTEDCPVRVECLTWALTTGRTPHGILGGLDGDQRDHQHRRRVAKIARHSTAAETA